MAKHNTTITMPTTTQFLVDAAREATSGLRRGTGDRAVALREFLAADTNDQRDDVIAQWGAEIIRRSLRVTALSFRKDEEVANLFWTLRDMVEDDGFLDDSDAVAEEDDNVKAAA